MSSQPVLDFEKLLAPVDGPNPSGTNLRGGAGREVYDQIRGARNQARVREKPQMMGDPNAAPGVPEEWSIVWDKCVEAIAQKSKDLELATYLIEALVRFQGFAGLRDGFRLYRELADRYWDTAYPSDEGDGPAGRVATMGGLNGDATRDGALRFPLFRVPLTDEKSGSLSAFQYEYALSIEQLPSERKQQRIDSGHVSLQTFEAAARATNSPFAAQLNADINECAQEFDKLAVLLEAKCGADAPPSSKIREMLQKSRTIVESLYKDRLVMNAPPTQPETGPGGTTSLPPEPTGPISSREQAFKTIEEIAQFFRRTEPHSPLIYALEQVVRWGKLPLPELLSELIQDDGARSRLFELIGIRPKDNSDGS